MRNPRWAPDYTRQQPSFNDMGALILNSQCSLNLGLLADFECNEGAGNVLHDVLGSCLPSITDATWDQKSLRGLACNGNTTRANITTPNILRLQPPITVVLNGYCYGAPTDYALLATVIYSSAFGSPYFCYGVACSTTSLYAVVFNDGTAYKRQSSSVAAVAGKNVQVACTIRNGLQRVYVNGTYAGGEATTAIPSIAYHATSQLVIGSDYINSRNANHLISSVLIYNRELRDREIFALYANPYGPPHNPRFLVQPRRTWFVPVVGGGTAYTKSLDATWAQLAASLPKQVGKTFNAT